MIRFHCANCNKLLEAPEQQIGELFACPCGAATAVPREDDALSMDEMLKSDRKGGAGRSNRVLVLAATALVLAVVAALLFKGRSSPRHAAATVPDVGDLSRFPATAPAGASQPRESMGLLRCIPSAPITAAPIVAGNTVYFGDRGGAVFAIDAQTLQSVGNQQLPSGVTALIERDGQLQAWCEDRALHPIATSTGTVQGGLEREPRPASDSLSEEDRHAWNTATAQDGRIIEHNGRYYRPVSGGSVKVTDGKRYRLLTTSLSGVESWEIALLPAAPIGYSDSGLWRLSPLLVPVEQLADFQMSGTEKPRAIIASDGLTIALAHPTPKAGAWTLEIRSLDGKQVFKTLVVSPAQHESNRLVPLKGGYLFCGDELAWIAADRAATWRFNPHELPTGNSEAVSDQRKPARPASARPANSRRFTPCVIAENRFFVGSAEGGIFVFDAASLTPGSGPAAAAR